MNKTRIRGSLNFFTILVVFSMVACAIILLLISNTSDEILYKRAIENGNIQIYKTNQTIEDAETAPVIDIDYSLIEDDLGFTYIGEELVLTDYIYMNGKKMELVDNTIYISDYLYYLGMEGKYEDIKDYKDLPQEYDKSLLKKITLQTKCLDQYGIYSISNTDTYNVVIYETSYSDLFIHYGNFSESGWKNFVDAFYKNVYVNTNTIKTINNSIVYEEDELVKARVSLDNNLILYTYEDDNINKAYNSSNGIEITYGNPIYLSNDEFVCSTGYILLLNGYDISNMTLEEIYSVDTSQFVGTYYDVSFTVGDKTIVKSLKYIKSKDLANVGSEVFDVVISNQVFEELYSELNLDSPVNYLNVVDTVNFIDTNSSNFDSLLTNLLSSSTINFEARTIIDSYFNTRDSISRNFQIISLVLLGLGIVGIALIIFLNYRNIKLSNHGNLSVSIITKTTMLVLIALLISVAIGFGLYYLVSAIVGLL